MQQCTRQHGTAQLTGVSPHPRPRESLSQRRRAECFCAIGHKYHPNLLHRPSLHLANAFTPLSPSRSRRRRRRRRTYRTVRGYSTLRYSTTRHMTLGYTLYGSRRAHSHTLLKSSLMLSTHLLLLFSSLWIAATYSTVTKQSREALARTHALGATLRTTESFPASAARRDRHL